MADQNTKITDDEKNRFSEDLGRLFELGFNTGFLTALQQHEEVKTHFGTVYEQDLKHLRFSKLVEKMHQRTGVISPWDQVTLKRWFLFFLQKGFLAGVNFLAEYLQSFHHLKPQLTRTIVYLQCNFYGRNSLGTYEKNAHTAIRELMMQFQAAGHDIHFTDADIDQYMKTGNFLNADLLLLLKYGRYWRILCIDLSVFSVRALEEASDLTSIKAIHRMIAREFRYTRSKSVFTSLSIDTDASETTEEVLSGQLKSYFTAFKREDKESVKLIQAASYTHSFYDFLEKKGVVTENTNILFNIIGYTDRSISAMALNKKQLSLLATCAAIYKEKPSERTIAEARDYVLQTIQKAASKSFEQGRDFTKSLLHIADEGDGIHWLRHTEHIQGFTTTQAPLLPEQVGKDVRQHLTPIEYEGKNLLDVHASLIHQELTHKEFPYLFLTGHPGIGKTTSVVDFLKAADQQGEGFLFIYVSPRKQVNLDIIQKFREDTKLPPCDNLFALTANTVIIRNNNAKKTVHYYSQQRKDTFVERGVTFIHSESEEATQQRTKAHDLEEIQEGLLIDKGEHISGVLDSLCSALHATLEKPLAKAIVATVAIQSLKRTGKTGENTTLRHLNTIFQGFYSKEGKPVPHKMQKLCEQIKHIFVMIDEVTGDESGVEFLNGLYTFMNDHQLLNSPYGINTKIIVADASIVGPEVIQQHLATTDYEPDKIYFRRLPALSSSLPLSISSMPFKNKKLMATVINANAFPASKLIVNYKIGVDVIPYNEDTFSERAKQLQEDLQDSILQDILAVLDRPNAPQLLVYIQSKQRLARLIQKVRGIRGTFQRDTEYLEIHANVSEAQKEAIQEFRKTTKVVFMTASASRGLSFPNATRIVVDIPHFEIEQNLMEILQVIYRGRGGDHDQEEKTLTFYLTDQILYSEQEDRVLAVRESILHLLNVLLILKTSMMTRIEGSGKLGLSQRFMMIPIGGKSVFAAGETFTARMGKLLKELQDLHHLHWNDKRLEFVHSVLKQTLEHTDIDLVSEQQRTKINALTRHSYLSLIPTLSQDFEASANRGFDHLLHFPPLEIGYISGGLLTVPILNRTMQEKYSLQVEKSIEHGKKMPDLLATMYALSNDREYPESMQMALRDAIALIKALNSIKVGKISSYEQESYHTDQHYTIPLITFLVADIMKAFFANKHENKNAQEATFRSLLGAYVQRLYPANSLLPLGEEYDDFPFIVFRSLNLGEVRRKMFTGKYLFMSHEFNIINMLLSSKE